MVTKVSLYAVALDDPWAALSFRWSYPQKIYSLYGLLTAGSQVSFKSWMGVCEVERLVVVKTWTYPFYTYAVNFLKFSSGRKSSSFCYVLSSLWLNYLFEFYFALISNILLFYLFIINSYFLYKAAFSSV